MKVFLVVRNYCIVGFYVCILNMNDMESFNDLGFNELSVDRKYAELVGVLEVMQKYNRVDGWMRWDGDKVRFYDGEVDGGVYIKVEWIRFWVAAFK